MSTSYILLRSIADENDQSLTVLENGGKTILDSKRAEAIAKKHNTTVDELVKVGFLNPITETKAKTATKDVVNQTKVVEPTVEPKVEAKATTKK